MLIKQYITRRRNEEAFILVFAAKLPLETSGMDWMYGGALSANLTADGSLLHLALWPEAGQDGNLTRRF